MIVAIGTDHAGFAPGYGHRGGSAAGHTLDCGAFEVNRTTTTRTLRPAARAVIDERASRGILTCGSGVGVGGGEQVCRGRRHLPHCFSARQGVEDDAMNVLALGARVVGPSLAAELIGVFLRAEFSGAERHRRRLEKVRGFERGT